MPFPLHKAPRGLLELYNLKTLGAQPFQFGDQVAPTIDTFEFYQVPQLSSEVFDTGAAAFPHSITHVTSTTLRLIGVAADTVIGAAGGTYLGMRVGIRLPSTVRPFATMAGGNAVPVAGGLYVFGGVIPTPFVLPAGAQLELSALSDAGGADHVSSLRLIWANFAP